LLAQRQTILHLATWRFSISEVEQATLQQQLAEIDDLQLMKTLIDLLLQSATLEEFFLDAANITRTAAV
jgi:hypothetical protein